MISGRKQARSSYRAPDPGRYRQWYEDFKRIQLSPEGETIVDTVRETNHNVMIQAGAGTGKTTLLLKLLSHIEGSVFIGAFNKSIQTEIEGKVACMGLDNVDVTVKTIHAAGLNAYKPNYRDPKPLVEMNKVRIMLDELGQKDVRYAKYSAFLAKLVGFAKREGVGPLVTDVYSTWVDLVEHYSVDDELPTDSPSFYPAEDKESPRLDVDAAGMEELIDLAKIVYQRSIKECTEELDFDDMLLAPIVYNSKFRKYDYVFLDEVQDCSAIRQEISVRMMAKGGRMVAVGDRFQNIYGFSGCRHNEMDVLRDRMKMVELPLMTTYRCPKTVVGMAAAYVPNYKAAPNAPDGLPTRAVWLEPSVCVSCNGVVGEKPCPACQGKKQPDFWDEARGLGPDDVILCRNNKPLVELAYRLLRKGVACQIEGRDFASSLIKLCNRWAVKELNALESKLMKYKDKEMKRWRDKGNEERAAGVEDKVDTILCLIDATREAGKTRVADLVDKINQMFGEVKDGEKPRVLTLSTIHKAKGKEWDMVYLLGRGRYMPSPWAKKEWEVHCEEVCLPYVMLTRSKKGLVEIVVPTASNRRKN